MSAAAVQSTCGSAWSGALARYRSPAWAATIRASSTSGSPGSPSVRVTWEQIAEARPEVVVFMPCGYGLEAAAREAEGLLARPELAGVTSLFAVDASSYFSRPGPRLVDGVEILAAALHPEVYPAPDVRRLVRVHRG